MCQIASLNLTLGPFKYDVSKNIQGKKHFSLCAQKEKLKCPSSVTIKTNLKSCKGGYEELLTSDDKVGGSKKGQKHADVNLSISG